MRGVPLCATRAGVSFGALGRDRTAATPAIVSATRAQSRMRTCLMRLRGGAFSVDKGRDSRSWTCGQSLERKSSGHSQMRSLGRIVSKAGRPPKTRLLLFAFGDFAFNLYWQSIMLFLLFYYTDALSLPIGIAATIYMVASVWDGIANFAAGVLVDRRHEASAMGRSSSPARVPLGLTFVLTYMPPLAAAAGRSPAVFAAPSAVPDGLCRVNVPYLAMSARISPDPGDRAFVAGMRMLFGTPAAVVGRARHRADRALADRRGSAAQAYFGAAMCSRPSAPRSCCGRRDLSRRCADRRPPPATSSRRCSSLAGNRAFVTLNAAMMAMIVAITVLNKSVLYYFKYLLNDPDAGQLALASMGLVSAIAVPLWMLLGRLVGLRALWLIAAGLGMAGLIAFARCRFDGARTMQLFLVGMQAMIVGLNFVFWAMLPNTIEFGEREPGFMSKARCSGSPRCCNALRSASRPRSSAGASPPPAMSPTSSRARQRWRAMRVTVALVPLAVPGPVVPGDDAQPARAPPDAAPEVAAAAA